MNETLFGQNFMKRLRGSVHRRIKPSSYLLAILIRLQNSLFLVGGLKLPFDKRIVETSRRNTAVSVNKIFGISARIIADSTNNK